MKVTVFAGMSRIEASLPAALKISQWPFGIHPITLSKKYLASHAYYAQCLFFRDMKGGSKENRMIDPLRVFKKHTAVVEDVCWHWTNENLLASVSDDRKLFMY